MDAVNIMFFVILVMPITRYSGCACGVDPKSGKTQIRNIQKSGTYIYPDSQKSGNAKIRNSKIRRSKNPEYQNPEVKNPEKQKSGKQKSGIPKSGTYKNPENKN